MQWNLHAGWSGAATRKLGALLFLMAVALAPVLIVALFPKQGGIWIGGYVTGIVTLPFVAFGAIGAFSLLNDEGALIGTAVFGLIVIAISVAVALWSLFGSFPGL